MVNQEQESNGAAVKEFERLPKSVVPKHYQITLEPDLVNLTFVGHELIDIDIKEDTERIVFNSFELDVKEASFKPAVDGATFVPPKAIEMNKDDEQIILIFPSSLKAGTSGQLKVVFSGILNDKLRGFYRAKYPQADGQADKYAAVTQFEATDARRAFPCWDEPAIKARFEITLVSPADQVALSNMPVVKEEVREDGKKVVSFDVTPIMSTYLVAFVVGDFEYVEMNTTDGTVLVRVYTPPGKKEQGQFALEVTAKALPFYTEYFNIPYPLPKMDLIALSDFAAGAMENWGLVTYRETRLLVDPENTSAATKQYIALVVAHELAHQWFGNLVTMEWWTHLWLNEGFATFIEHLCVDHLFPEYNIWQQFVSDTYSRALELDALNNSHPIEVPVKNPSEVDEIFDDISYNKGASVIRMLYQYLGDDSFRKGMSLYLNRFKYKNTQTEDLWTALGEASSKPVREVMTTWTKQKGFPVIAASESIDGNGIVLNVSQTKFCAAGKIPDSEKDVLWMVPLTVVTSDSSSVSSSLLSSKSSQIVLNDVPPSSFLKLNKDSVGVYRVQYSPSLLARLVPAIASKALPPLDRLNVQDDLFALVQAGKTSTVEILKLLEAFKTEDEYPVWTSLSSCLGKINLLLSHTDFQESYHVWARPLLLPLYSQLGWHKRDGDKHTDTLLRSLILSRLAAFGEPTVVSEAKKLFESHANGSSIIPPDIRSAVYSAVARNADEKIFNTFFALYRKAETQEEKNRLSGAIAAVPDTSMIQRVLDFAMSDEVRSQDAAFVVCYVAMNKHGREMAWKFFQEKVDVFRTRYGSGFLMSRLVKCVTENFATLEKEREVDTFFRENPFPGTERTVQQSLESIRLNANWLSRDADDIKKFINTAIA